MLSEITLLIFVQLEGILKLNFAALHKLNQRRPNRESNSVEFGILDIVNQKSCNSTESKEGLQLILLLVSFFTFILRTYLEESLNNFSYLQERASNGSHNLVVGSVVSMDLI